MTDVFLHVGMYKTGTTTIQAALAATSARLADEGVLFPGGRRASGSRRTTSSASASRVSLAVRRRAP